MTVLDHNSTSKETPAAVADGRTDDSDVGAHPAGQNRIDDIEILRAVAIIFVLIEHVQLNLFPWLLGNGVLYTYFGFWNGVDLFFAISGFVIARSLMPSLAATGNTTDYFKVTLAFWIRRVWRLLPSAWLWLAVILVATLAFNRSGVFGAFKTSFEGAVAAILDVANFRTILVFGRFDTGPTFPYWSLSLEEQFYLLLPILILLSGRRLPWVLGIGVLLQIFVPRIAPTAGLLGLIMNQTKSDALLLGVLIAIWSGSQTYQIFDPVFLNKRPWIGAVMFLGLIFLLAAVGSQSLHIVPFQVGLIAVISAVLVLIASYDKNCFCPRGPLKSVLLWFGSRSYAIYLIHIPTFLATREIWFRLQPPGTIFTDRFGVRFAYTAAILLFVLVELSYRLVEMPLRRRGAQIARRIVGNIAA